MKRTQITKKLTNYPGQTQSTVKELSQPLVAGEQRTQRPGPK